MPPHKSRMGREGRGRPSYSKGLRVQQGSMCVGWEEKGGEDPNIARRYVYRMGREGRGRP